MRTRPLFAFLNQQGTDRRPPRAWSTPPGGLFKTVLLLLCTWPACVLGLPAFPGAEGFGALATGGRGGQVLYVTTLAPDPQGVLPGSLNWALRQEGPRYILFRVSGVIHAPARVVHGNVTLAGQTSPGGIIVRGLLCDGHYDRHACGNLIVRHLRSRPASHRPIPSGGEALDDAVRLDGITQFIIDRSSFAHAEDEVAQISWASHGTIQNSLLAETVGSHAEFGGMLMNYAHPDHPQDALSFHHNVWFRLGGRLPEISCEASGYPDEPGSVTECAARPLRLELSSNLQWDPGINIWYTPDIDANPANGPYRVDLNWISNYAMVRPTHGFGFMSIDMLQVSQNRLFATDNRMSRWPLWLDWQLAYCCNDFDLYGPNTDMGSADLLMDRHPFPAITYSPSDTLQALLPERVGAFPHDPMDRRILARVRSGEIQPLPHAQPEAEDAFELDFDPLSPPSPPLDSDNDGMPDVFENAYAHLGLNPFIADHNGSEISVALTGAPGYTNLEYYLNWLSDALVTGGPLTPGWVFGDGFETP